MRMRAAVFEAPRSVKIQTLPVQKPAPGQVLVRMEGSGICGSDLPLWQGRARSPYPQPPGRPGHEGWGIVSALGLGVKDLHIGDRVSGVFDGAFAEIGHASPERIVKLPRRLDGLQFPGEPLACAVNAFRRSGIRRGDTVAIIGVGFLGAILAQLASRVGATVIAIGRRAYALGVARAVGVKHALPLDEDTVDCVRNVTGGRLCDVVVEATGEQAPLDVAARLVRDRGRIVIVGYHQAAPRDFDTELWYQKGLDVVNAHERDADAYLLGLQEAIALVAKQEIEPAPLFTHRFTLDEIGEGFRTLEERPDGFLKAVVEI